MYETLLEITSPLLKNLVETISRGIFDPKELPKEQLETIGRLLTGRLVYLLRYIDQFKYSVTPQGLGGVLQSFKRVKLPAKYNNDAEEGWAKASEYACVYLSMLGLLKTGGIGGEVIISDFGKSLIRSDYIKTIYGDVFEWPLP